jgi:predicted AlkP superfamily pyrophosphatase or phosphodiesterase
MRKLILPCILFCAMASASAQEKKVLFIIIDGVSKDVIEKVATPNLDAIAQEGAFLSAYQGGERNGYTQTPTISAPGYNNVLTGVWFNKHNVPDNAIKAPNYHYPTIFRLFEDQFPEKKTAIFSSWQDNRTKLIGEGLPQTGHIRLDYHFDGLELDTVKYPHDKSRKFMAAIDQAVTDATVRAIGESAPDLSWVYLEFPDDMGHMHGDSEPYTAAVQHADRQIGQIWSAIKQRREKYKEDWLLVVTTDHGRDAKGGRGHGGQSERERAAWIVTNAELNDYARQAGQVSVVDILPTISRFLGMKLSTDRQRELDGIPLTGQVSLSGLTAVRSGNTIQLNWMPRAGNEKVKIWLATTNTYKLTGKPDAYRLVAEVPVKQARFDIDLVADAAADIYKVVVEGRHNMVSRWVLKD